MPGWRKSCGGWYGWGLRFGREQTLTDVSGLYPAPREPGANAALSDDHGFTHGTSGE